LCYRYIGLDRRNKKLIPIDHYGDEKQEQCICLRGVAEGKIIHVKDEDQNIKSVLPALSRKTIHWKAKVDIHKRRRNITFEAEYIL
jgi:hypothetical protein